MATVKKASLFPAELAREMFSKVVGHSSLAKLSNQKPVPFNGVDQFVFDFGGEVSIVAESGAKPAGGASVTSVQIRPVKVVYQSRVSDEFIYAAEERKLEYLRSFADGFTKKVGRALDIMAMHGVNPATGSDSSIIGDNNFDDAIDSSNIITLEANSTLIDANIEAAIAKVTDEEFEVTGIAMAPAARTKMAEVKEDGKTAYPDFKFGQAPSNLGGAELDVNSTVSANSSLDRVIVGDFENAFKWGYALNIPLEVIEYGNPDGGTYDLKQANEVLLRSEAFIGWGILNADAFAKVVAPTPSPAPEG